MTDERKQFERAIDGFEERFRTLKLLSGDGYRGFCGALPLRSRPPKVRRNRPAWKEPQADMEGTKT